MIEPFASLINFETGLLERYDNKLERKLTDLQGMFSDESAYKEALAKENSVLYEVYEKEVPIESGQLAHAVTILHPGQIGDEYYMTKGHFHEIEDTAELYLGIQGQGGIIMQDKSGKTSYIDMKPGTLVYVSPFWAHRTVNTGSDIFSFLAIYPAEAGHDYGTIIEKGFAKLVVEQDGKPTLIDNPNFGAGGRG